MKEEKQKTITARDIKNLSDKEIDKIQDSIDIENLKYIDQAYKDKQITLEEKEYLENYYKSGMESYRKVYAALYNIFEMPQKIVSINTDTGEVDTYTEYYYGKKNKKKKHKEVEITYDFKDITPFTSMRLEYRDRKGDSLYIILPVMKKPKRAIEKILDYRQEYNDGLAKAQKEYAQHGDIEKYHAALSKLKSPCARLNDVLRFTVTCQNYSGVEHIVKLFSKNDDMNINPAETRSLFKENDMACINDYLENSKSYFDIKMFLHLMDKMGVKLNAEAQIKIHILYLADLKTHKIYEEQRKVEESLKKNRPTMTDEEIRQAESRIKIYKMTTQKINKEAIHEYNIGVLNKIRWIENGFKASRIPPDLPDGTYKVCRQLLQKDYMVRPFKAFDVDKEFAKDDEYNAEIAQRCNIDMDAISQVARRYKHGVGPDYPHTNESLPVADRDYKGIADKYRYEVQGGLLSAAEKTEWDNYGESKKYIDISNKNMYKNAYSKESYWEDYDKADNIRKLKARLMVR